MEIAQTELDEAVEPGRDVLADRAQRPEVPRPDEVAQLAHLHEEGVREGQSVDRRGASRLGQTVAPALRAGAARDETLVSTLRLTFERAGVLGQVDPAKAHDRTLVVPR